MILNGSIRALLLFDISEEIDLQRLRTILGANPVTREPAFRHPSPEYVRYEQPPVADLIGACDSFEGRAMEGRIRYFDYGVASIELRAAFNNADWQEVISLSNHWVLSDELEKRARALLNMRLGLAKEALIKPYADWIAEDYYVIQVDPTGVTSEDLVREYGNDCADCTW